MRIICADLAIRNGEVLRDFLSVLIRHDAGSVLEARKMQVIFW